VSASPCGRGLKLQPTKTMEFFARSVIAGNLIRNHHTD